MKDLGVFKPLVISKVELPEIEVKKGTILGGRTRYYIAKDLAKIGYVAKVWDGENWLEETFDPVWITWVAPKDKETAIAYALADNDSAGVYVEEELADLVKDVNLNLETYKVNIRDGMSIQQLLDNLGPSDVDIAPPADPPQSKRTYKCPNCGEEFRP